MQPKRSVWMAERAIVLQVLRDDHPAQWTRGELEQAASDLGPRAVHDGIHRLEAEGVIVALDGHFLASRCARCLDTLGFICL